MKPVVLTMGEPAGIGGELTLKSWLMRHGKNLPEFAVLDDPERLKREAQRLDTNIPIKIISDLEEVEDVFEKALPVFPVNLSEAEVPGQANAKNGKAVVESILLAVELTKSGKASGIVTNPINKSTLHDAGLKHGGHTEFLAELAGGNKTPVMMLVAEGLKVVPLTIHIPIKDVAGSITKELICEKAKIISAALKNDFGIESPRLIVAGLNPHAGEGGKIGSEEEEIIFPAVKALQGEGINITGPHSADTMFHEDAREKYDVALCMYHDQALIPIKSLDFYGGVNVTLGLDLVRTSPDHGTAMNIAGKGIARPDSLAAALRLAAEISARRAEA